MAGWLARLRLAWRDLWAQGRRSVFFSLLVAAGVASLVGVQGMARSLEASMRDTARQMIQGDLAITKSDEFTQAQKDALHELEHQGAKVTEVTNSNGHVKNDLGHAIVEIKVVDQKVWPFYGGFQSSPAGVRLGKGEALVGPELLTTLALKVGDSIEVGKSTFKIVGTVVEEPRQLGQIPIGPRVLVSKETWANAPGNQQVQVKLPATLTVADAKARLAKAFDESTIQTSEDAWKSMAGIMDKVFTFLSMVALISLLVGGLGVAMGMRTFISQKLEHIAVLKALGATSGTVMSVFLAEAAMLGIAGSIAGAGLGLGVQVLLPKLFEGLVPVAGIKLNWMAAASGLAAGVVIAVLSALVPVRAIRAIKPVALFRGDTGGSKRGWKAWAETLFVGCVTLAGVAWMAMTYAKSTLVGLGFLGGLLVATLLLFLISWVLLRVLRLLPQAGLPAVRHAVRSLHAPGNQSASVVVAMGLGIMLMTTVYLIQSTLLEQVKAVGVGPDTPNLYIMSHGVERRADMMRFLQTHPQVRKVGEETLAVTGEILAVDGRSLGDPKVEGSLPVEMITNSPAAVPKGIDILEGQWFTPVDQGQRNLTVRADFAQKHNIRVGSTVTFRLKNESVPFTVTSLYQPSGDGMMMMHMGTLSAAPGSIDPYASEFMLTAVTKRGREEAVMIDLLEQYPEAMPISLANYVKLIESLMTRVSNILQFLTAFAVVAAGVILSGSLSATRFRRRKEGALLKSLGASRATVAIASALENGLLGLVAGLAGAALAYGMVQAAGMALKMSLSLDLLPLATASLAGCALAVLVGVGATFDVLQVKPLSVLRSE